MKILIILFGLLLSISAFARDVHVKGYTRASGTYVAPYVRSSPDSSKSNNYGSPSSYDTKWNTPTQQRDQDGNGIANQYDNDDNNDGVLDD